MPLTTKIKHKKMSTKIKHKKLSTRVFRGKPPKKRHTPIAEGESADSLASCVPIRVSGVVVVLSCCPPDATTLLPSMAARRSN